MISHRTTASSFDVKVDGQTPESWSAVLAQFDDASIYQTWAYGAVRWGKRNLSHFVLSQDGELRAAAQLRLARLPLLPAGVAYLRWGPLYHLKDQSTDPAVAIEMMAGLRNEYCGRRHLALQVIPNIYVGDSCCATIQNALTRAKLRPSQSGPGYRTVTVDLTLDVELMRKRLDQKWRNQLNRSEKNGLMLEASDRQETYRQFVQLYEAMWERKRFETSVDVHEFGRMQDLLVGPAKMQTFLARKDGEAIGAVVCSLMGERGIYLLGATNEKGREMKAAYFLQWQAMLWLKERGARSYDLGGIDPEANPGGYHFKAGFGGIEQTQLGLHACPGGFLSAGVAALARWRRPRSSASAVK